MKSRIVQKKVNPMVAATSVTTQPVVIRRRLPIRRLIGMKP